MRPHLRRAHYDENRIVETFCKRGYPALRIPGSGASKYFPGDVLVFLPNKVKILLIRRSETGYNVVFTKEEIRSVKSLADRIASLIYPTEVIVSLLAHFPKRRIWKEKRLLWNDDIRDVTINIGGHRRR